MYKYDFIWNEKKIFFQLFSFYLTVEYLRKILLLIYINLRCILVIFVLMIKFWTLSKSWRWSKIIIIVPVWLYTHIFSPHAFAFEILFCTFSLFLYLYKRLYLTLSFGESHPHMYVNRVLHICATYRQTHIILYTLIARYVFLYTRTSFSHFTDNFFIYPQDVHIKIFIFRNTLLRRYYIFPFKEKETINKRYLFGVSNV